MRRRRLTVGSVILLAGLLAVPVALLDAAITPRAAGAVTFDVPAMVVSPPAPPDSTTGFDTGYAVNGSITVSASGTWCTHTTPAPAYCNGPNGNPSWSMAPNFLYQVAGTAFALVGRIGITGPWTLVGTGPTTLTGNGELYLAQNDQRGVFGDNSGTLQVTYQRLAIPGANPSVSPSITSGERAAWAVPIVNSSSQPLTGVTATFHATANGSIPLTFDGSMMPGCAPGAGNSEVCSVANIPANATRQFNVFAKSDGLGKGTTIAGDVTVSAAGEANVAGTLGGVTVAVVLPKLSVPALNPPVSPSITSGDRAAWTVPISNVSNAPLTGVIATLKATSGTTALNFDESLMPGCTPGALNTEVCNLGTIPANTTTELDAFADVDVVGNGKMIAGFVSVSAAGETAGGFLGQVTVVSCGAACVISVGAPGAPVSSIDGPPTDKQPTKQVVSFPGSPPGSPPVAIKLQSVNPGPKLSDADKLLCPPTTPCSGQISVVGGDFRKYNDKRHPVKIQIIAKWKSLVPPGRILMAKPGFPPIQLATCVRRGGRYNTPCQMPDVVKGTAALRNLMTVTTIFFVRNDPRMARHVVTGPDAPTAVKATAGKKKATVSWSAPVVTNGRITKYSVTPYLGKVAWPTVSFAGNLRKGTISGLVSGKIYTFKVVAATATGVSLASKASKAVKVT